MSNYRDYKIYGVHLASGRQAFGSKEMAEWLPLFIEYMRVKFGIRLVIIKVRDAAATAASASTHLGGWAVDIRSWNLTASERAIVIREATRFGLILHYRVSAQGFQPHLHGMLNVGYWTPCSYQIDRTKQGRDGLARNGPDRERSIRPPQSQWKLCHQGTAALKQALNLHNNNKKEQDMALTEADAKLVAREVWNQMITSGGQKSTGLALAQSRNYDEAQSNALGTIAASMRRLSDEVGAVKRNAADEKAIIAGVVGGVSGTIHDSVVKAIEAALGDIDAAEAHDIANAAVASINASLKA